MKKKNNDINPLVVFGSLAGATVFAYYIAKKFGEKSSMCSIKDYKNHYGKEVYFVGGGLASLAGAAYLIRDCNMPGKNIHILEGMHILGGSNDGAGDVRNGFIARVVEC